MRALDMLGNIADCSDLNELDRCRAVTTVLLIVLQTNGSIGTIDRPAATDILRQLFGCGEGKDRWPKGIALVDVRERLAFDFRGMRVIKSTFSNYDCFWECEFDTRTSFEECNLTLLPKKERLNIALRRRNFDRSCIIDQTVVDAVENPGEQELFDQTAARAGPCEHSTALLALGLHDTTKGGVIRARYKGQWPIQNLLKVLTERKVLLPYSSEKSAKMGPELQVAGRYHAD